MAAVRKIGSRAFFANLVQKNGLPVVLTRCRYVQVIISSKYDDCFTYRSVNHEVARICQCHKCSWRRFV